MYKVKNITKDVRKFRYKNNGKYIFVNPNQSILIQHAPKECSVWQISKESSIPKIEIQKTKNIYPKKHKVKKNHIDKKEKRKLNIMEVENDSSSSR